MMLHLDPASGASGDMFLGMFLALGVSPEVVREAAASVAPGEFELAVTGALRGGIKGTMVDVRVSGHDNADGDHSPHSHHGRRLADVLELIDAAGLDARVAERSAAVFRSLAEAEGRVHGIPAAEVHFHEVGAVDSIVDVVGSCAALQALGVERVTSSAVATGTGTVICDHGELPVPAPATVELLKGIPTRPTAVQAELTTPTGAALLREFVDEFAPPPAGAPVAQGYGAGSRDEPGRADLLRGVIYEPAAAATDERMVVTEAVIDDMTGEIAGELHERLAAAGAVEVALSHVGLKKSRPGLRVTALSAPGAAEAVAEAMLRHSTTLGCRRWEVGRRVLERRFAEVETPWGAVRVKLGIMGGETVNAAPEYEDCRRLADEAGVPTKTVFAAALAAWGAGAGGEAATRRD